MPREVHNGASLFEIAFSGTTNCHLYHYAGNNPVRYTDPDGREKRVEIPVTKEIGNLAHKTAYPLVSNAIEANGYKNVKSNGWMLTANGSAKINRKRPDWQSPMETELDLWEMKHANEIAARSDIDYYIAQAASGGVKAQAGKALGKIAERVSVEGLKDIFMDINSPSPGVIVYDIYKIIPDSEPVAQSVSIVSSIRDVQINLTPAIYASAVVLGFILVSLCYN